MYPVICMNVIASSKLMDVKVIEGIDGNISEGPDTRSSDAGIARTESITKAPSPASSKIEIDNFGMDLSTERKADIVESPFDEWKVNNNLQSPKKTKKRHPSVGLWE